MGNCCERCFGKFDKRRYLRTRYNVERDISIEFENLMDEESQDNDLTRANVPLLTDSEKAWLQSCRYDILVEEQKFVDDKLKKELVQQEDELRREEEAYCHAKGQGFQAVRSLLKKDGGFQRLSPSPNLQHKSQATWLEENDGNWDVAVDEEDDDDFESFLECVKARSAAARNHVNNLLVVPDMVSDDDRSKTEASSIDLEWEHEAGMQPIQASGKKTLYSTSVEDDTKPSLRTEKLSSDFEWDNDFVGGPSQLCSKIDTINNNVSGNLNCLHNHSLAATSSAENIPPR